MGANLHRLLTKSAWDGAMQITSSTAHPVSPSVATGPQRVETEAGRFALAVAEPDGRPSVEDIFAKYDLNNISPREIDQLVDAEPSLCAHEDRYGQQADPERARERWHGSRSRRGARHRRGEAELGTEGAYLNLPLHENPRPGKGFPP